MFVRKAWLNCHCPKCDKSYTITLTKADEFEITDYVESLSNAKIHCYFCSEKPKILNAVFPCIENGGDYGNSGTGEWQCVNKEHKMTYYPLVIKRAIEEQILAGPANLHEKDLYRGMLAAGLPWKCPICFKLLKHNTRTARRYETFTLWGKI